MFFNKTLFDENGKAIEIELICNRCGKIIIITDISQFSNISSDYCVVKEDSTIICDSCGNKCKNGLIEYKKITQYNKCITNNPVSQPNIPHCPKCGSTAITAGARGVNFIWGLIGASKTVDRCANCGYTWSPKK